MKATSLKFLAVLAVASPLLLAGCHSDEHPGEGANGAEHPEQSKSDSGSEHPEEAGGSEHPE